MINDCCLTVINCIQKLIFHVTGDDVAVLLPPEKLSFPFLTRTCFRENFFHFDFPKIGLKSSLFRFYEFRFNFPSFFNLHNETKLTFFPFEYTQSGTIMIEKNERFEHAHISM